MGIKFSQLPLASEVASDDYIAVLDTSENVLKRTAISHASETDAYGLGTAQAYGHNKVIDNLGSSTYANGEVLSAHAGNTLATNVGKLEMGATAASAHSKGEYFMWDGNGGHYVKAVTAIAVGDTLTLGTNVAAVDATSVVSESSMSMTRFSDTISTQTKTISNSAFKSTSLVDIYYSNVALIKRPVYTLGDGTLVITLASAPSETVNIDVKVVN